jgi:hypothetical protein
MGRYPRRMGRMEIGFETGITGTGVDGVIVLGAISGENMDFRRMEIYQQ